MFWRVAFFLPLLAGVQAAAQTVSSLTFSPNPVVEGNTTAGTLTVTGLGASSVTVTLTAQPPILSLPAAGIQVNPDATGGGGIIGVDADGERENYKPNYLSIMNYQYTFSGIRYADAPGSTQDNPALARYFDYSDQVLPTGGNTPGSLDESRLNEPAGLGSGNAKIFWFWDRTCHRQRAATDGPVDWDGDGHATNPDASANLLPWLGTGCGGGSDVLRGHNDWLDIRKVLGIIGSTPVVPKGGGVVHEAGLDHS